MKWNKINEVLPKDKQEIIVYDEGLKTELKRIFNIKFWEKYKRILFCSHFCKKWRPYNKD